MISEFWIASAVVIQEAPRMSSIVQALWLGTAIVFVVSVLTVGFTAKRIENLHNPTYGKAFLSVLLIGPFSLITFLTFAAFFQAHWLLSLIVAYSLIPILIYRIVFSCSMWREAALIWIVTFLVQGLVGAGLAVVGILKLAEFVS